DGVVNAADKKAGYAGDLADVTSTRGQLFKASDISFGYTLINFLREQQRHIDVDTFADQLLEGGNALGGAGNFDHHILAGHGFPQPPRLRNRALGVASEIGRDFKADVSVAAFGADVNRTQEIGSILNVADGENLVAGLGI